MGGVALVLPGGGERLIAWETGVLAGLADADVDLRRASEVLGSSAGATAGARLAAGVDPREIADRLEARESGKAMPRVADRDRSGDDAPRGVFRRIREVWAGVEEIGDAERAEVGRAALEADPVVGEEELVEAIGRRLRIGTEWPAALRLVAFDAESGERRVFDGRGGVSLARAVAASSAVPGLFPGIAVGERRYFDAAVGSATNADLLAGPASAVVILSAAPRDSEPGSIPFHWARALEREVAALEERGARVTVVLASDADQEAMGPRPMDGSRSPLAAASGRETGRRAADAVREVTGRELEV